MDQQPQISVIMPVYNAERLLGGAVGSVLAQEGVSLELILVDDGSTDGSAAQCDAFAAQDKRVRVLHRVNGGICAARNAGIEAARGEYLAFCDDDDCYLPGFLQRACALARQHGADIVRMDYRILREGAGGTRELPHKAGPANVLRPGDGGKAYDVWLRGAGPLFVWNALYARAAVGALRFAEDCCYGLEDFLFNAAFQAGMHTAVYEPQVAYLHTERRGGTSADVSAQAVRGRLPALARWMQAEYAAAERWCAPPELATVWNERRANGITFLMHQLRDAAADDALYTQAWRALRGCLKALPHGAVDFLNVEGHNRKQMLALLLFELHGQRLFFVLSKKEGTG